jgi:predicted NAD-dependent protein-ADP-ribosyltransferase YbiA (DUF1768 family)
VTPIDSLAALLDAIKGGYRPRYLFFWGHTASSPEPGRWVLSQWWPAAFTLDGVRYPTAEHFMMAEKARRFGDHDAAGAHPGRADAWRGEEARPPGEGLRRR